MNNIKPEHLLVIDIETVTEYLDFTLMPANWQQLWTEKMGRFLENDADASLLYQQKAGVMAEFSKIICIGLGTFTKMADQYHFQVVTFSHQDEAILLREFTQALLKLDAIHHHWQITGHNIREFDLPFLSRRLLINQMPIPLCIDFQNKKPWETNVLDTFQYWRFGDYKQFISLDLLATVLQIPSPKSDINGSMVGQIYRQPNGLERIARYCSRDVITVANIMLRLKGLPLLQPTAIAENEGIVAPMYRITQSIDPGLVAEP